MLTGSINKVELISGSINGGAIKATINPVFRLSGLVNSPEGIFGKINPHPSLSGIVNKEQQMSAVVGIYEGMNPEKYDGDYVFNPKTDSEQTIDTEHKFLTRDIIVNKIPYFETANLTGTTVYIGD